jgi:acetolactate synthase-1/2/3 large subunit
MARGLLGAGHPLQMRHQRKQALREADLVVLAGVPCDFRLDYGRHISGSAVVIALNRSDADLRRNRRPSLAVQADPDLVLRRLAETGGSTTARRDPWQVWRDTLQARDGEREAEISARAAEPTTHVNPLTLFRALDAMLPERSMLVTDGGDFVATASYVLRPRTPLSWLDPGVFGTLGVGGGFVLGAHAARPDHEIWLIWGDGAAAYSLGEVDTFVRHGVPAIAVIGNDASWAQIAREQVELLGESTGTDLRHSDYHRVAEGFGGKGLLLDANEAIDGVLGEARRLAQQGHPVVINAILARTDFRKGSISI